MGASFTNLALRGPGQEEVLSFLESLARRSFVSPTVGGWTLVAEAESKSFDFQTVHAFAEEVTRQFGCAGLSVQFYDDDVLLAQVHTSGTFVESYSSNPAYGAEDIAEMLEFDRGGDAEKIAVALDMPEAAQAVQKALHADPEETDVEYADLNERLSAAMQSGDVDAMRQVQLRLMAKTRELSESGEDPFLMFAPGYQARRRYAGLVKALSLPPFCQDFGFTYLEASEMPSGLEKSGLRRTRNW